MEEPINNEQLKPSAPSTALLVQNEEVLEVESKIIVNNFINHTWVIKPSLKT